MRNKPGNIVLAILAVCMLADILIVRPTDEGDFLISIGVFGAPVSRAFLDDSQPIVICILGLALTMEAVLRNHGIIDRNSDAIYVLFLFVALLYALWEKIRYWFSL
jgi:hypothetical protein